MIIPLSAAFFFFLIKSQIIQIFASYECRENSLKDLEKRESETNES